MNAWFLAQNSAPPSVMYLEANGGFYAWILYRLMGGRSAKEESNAWAITLLFADFSSA